MTPAAPKALVYWRKNYLFGVARPGALICDGTTFACLDNDLATVFSAPLSSVRVTKGFGIFRLFIDGVRASYLTPIGGTPSPEPSAALLHFLQQPLSGSPADAVDAASAIVSGLGGAAGQAIGDVVSSAAVTVSYVTGMKGLESFLRSVGALASR